MSLVHPDKIFANVPPLPRPWTKSISPLSSESSIVSPSLQWKQAEGYNKTLPRELLHLQQTLRSVHKRKVAWPIEESLLTKYASSPTATGIRYSSFQQSLTERILGDITPAHSGRLQPIALT